MSLVTPLNRVLGLGTAKGAAEHWWMQRLTAVALVPLALWFAYGVLALPDFSFASVVDRLPTCHQTDDLRCVLGLARRS